MGVRIGVLAGLLFSGVASADAIDQLIDRMPGKPTVLKRFDTGKGPIGLVLARGKGDPVVVFADPNGRWLMSGLMLDDRGNNLTKAFVSQHVPQKDLVAEAIKSAAWVEDGKPDAEKTLYVIGEPNCGYCKKQYATLAPLVAKGELAVRWIMIGFSAEAASKVAAVLDQDNKAKALEQVYRGADLGAPKSESLSKIEANRELATEFGMQGTPMLFYRAKNGSIQKIPGYVEGDELQSHLKTMGRS